MNYELAKRLKDAGFPQGENNPQVHTDICGNFENTDPACRRENRGVLPTLEELIEACGDKILGLNRTHADDGTPNGWVADTHTHECICGKSNCFGFNWEHEEGSTPLIAVANLWLALNPNI